MENREWNFLPKEEKIKLYGEGDWVNEPDKVQWRDEETGLACLAVRNLEVGGHWCGYVGVAETHKLYARAYNMCSLPEAKPRGVKPGDKAMAEGETLPGSDIKLPKMPDRWVKDIQERLVCSSERDYCDHSPESMFNVHGGITFSGFCQPDKYDAEKGICHVQEPGEPDVFWFGFDCAHYLDISPGMAKFTKSLYDEDCEYRDLAYVKSQCKKLALQLKSSEK